MQNKANLLNAQMNISPVKTMNYEQLTMNYANKNKPNQTQPVVSLPNLFLKILDNLTIIISEMVTKL
jgi:hypothetical protein